MLWGVTRLSKKYFGYCIWHCVKYPEIPTFSDPYFPVNGQNRIGFCRYGNTIFMIVEFNFKNFHNSKTVTI